MSPSAREPRYAVLPTLAMPSGSQLSGKAITVGSVCWATRGGARSAVGSVTARAVAANPSSRRRGIGWAWVISPR